MVRISVEGVRKVSTMQGQIRHHPRRKSSIQFSTHHQRDLNALQVCAVSRRALRIGFVVRSFIIFPLNFYILLSIHPMADLHYEYTHKTQIQQLHF